MRIANQALVALILISSAMLPLQVALAGKPVKGGGGGENPPPTQTIFYLESPGQVVAINEYGADRTVVGDTILQNAVVSSLVYGSDPKLDRWWLKSMETEPSSEVYSYEIFAAHPGRGIQVQVTNFQAAGRKVTHSNLHHIRFSSDGQDSFFSFSSVNASGKKKILHRVNLPLSALEVMWLAPSWTPMEYGASAIEDAWEDGPGEDVESPGYVRTNFSHGYDWSPSGSEFAMVAGTYLTPGQWTSFLARFDVDNQQYTTLFTPTSSIDNFGWAPASSPIPDSIVFRGYYGIRLADAYAQTDPPLILENTSRTTYRAPVWSPQGERYIVQSSRPVKGAFSYLYEDALHIATLGGATTTIIPYSSTAIAPIDWCDNDLAPGYVGE